MSFDGFRFDIDPLAPRNSFSLNGRWELSPSSAGEQPSAFSHHVPVPGVVGCARPAYAWQDFRFHWYRTNFALEGDCPSRASLRIGQSQFGTEVWMNGAHVGSSISCYTSHEYDVRSHLRQSTNELVVRVGMKEDLPVTSAVGKDQEKQIYTPGIWGDVSLILTGNPRILKVQTIPDIVHGKLRAIATIENAAREAADVVLESFVEEKKSGTRVPGELQIPQRANPGNTAVSFELSIPNAALWTPDNPFLYVLIVRVRKGDQTSDETRTTFGMREFRLSGNQFLLNGKPMVLKGGNIAFHRFLTDDEREELPWDSRWIRRVLIEIPKEHNFNFFRNHLGQLYPRWYDVADEEGMLIQNEWHFWGTTGSKEQIQRELTDWIEDNWNHPSIVIWDPLNESTDETIQREIVPELRRIDPTRVWESVDFVEEHPYIYSLGPVLNDRRFGFTRAMRELEESKTPVMLNEFVWWWLDSSGKATSLMDGVTERWLGTEYTTDDLFAHQAFLAAELTELFRRMRVAAIQPFVYLSNNDGPTGHWFLGPIASLRPKPILAALRNAFAPFGVSIELWDRHFVPGERRTMRVFVFNDEPNARSGSLTYGIAGADDKWLWKMTERINLEGSQWKKLQMEFEFPERQGQYFVRAELESASGTAHSAKIAHVISPEIPSNLGRAAISLFGEPKELSKFLESRNIPFSKFSREALRSCSVFVISEGDVRNKEYAAIRQDVDQFVGRGGTLLVLEPENSLEGSSEITITNRVRIRMRRREDVDRGGYDSYAFMDDGSHPIWGTILPDHLKMFNGGFGGEIVSQHDLEIPVPHRVLARCGLHLKVIALAEIESGRGRILISRLQTRGRLNKRIATELYDRRSDPIAQQYMFQLLSYASTVANTSSTV